MNLISLHQACKQALRRSGFGDTALHVHLGLLIWLSLVVTIGRGDPASPWPVGLTLLIEAGNEVLDRARKGTWFPRETLLDFIHTGFWPVMVFVLVRYGVVLK